MISMYTKKTNYRFYDAVREPHIMLTPIEGFNKKPLVTLEEATFPLISIIPDIQIKVIEAKKRAASYTDDLSIDESAAIILYTMEWHPYTHSLYYILNTKLRIEDREVLKSWFLYLKLIFTALSRLPKISLTVYRGVLLSDYKKYQTEKSFVWWGFSSCSTDRNIAENKSFFGQTHGKTLFVIDCLKGIDISQHSYFRKEKEILLLPATTFKVIQCDRINDLHTIHLTEIESSYQLLESVSTNSKADLFKSTVVVNEIPSYSNPKLKAEIAQCKDRSHVCFFRKRFTDNDMEIIVQEVIVHKQCRVLTLRGDEMTSQGAFILANSLENNHTLKELYITDIQIGDNGAQALAKSLSNETNHSLKRLCLNQNGITDQGAEYLARMLQINKSLTHLWLPKNHIRDRGIHSLAQALIVNTTLQILSLEWNVFEQDETINTLAEMMTENETLIQVDIDGRDLTRYDIKKLKEAAKTKKDFKLKIH